TQYSQISLLLVVGYFGFMVTVQLLLVILIRSVAQGKNPTTASRNQAAFDVFISLPESACGLTFCPQNIFVCGQSSPLPYFPGAL
ncbi:MAG TPA: hypothetical protein VI636_23445, partial [Candidatus Angelobacter sp.]